MRLSAGKFVSFKKMFPLPLFRFFIEEFSRVPITEIDRSETNSDDQRNFKHACFAALASKCRAITQAITRAGFAYNVTLFLRYVR